MNLIEQYKEVKSQLTELEFLYNEFGQYSGGIDFVDAAHDALELKGRDLVWWCGMFSNYHNHDDYHVGSIIQTSKHMKNISLRYLNEQEYDKFKTWFSNWRDTLIIRNYLNPNAYANEGRDTAGDNSY